MEEVSLICGACGAEIFRLPKPEPRNAREAKQALFHCDYCGAVNLRDGTVMPKKEFPRQEINQEEKKDSAYNPILFLISIILTAAGVGLAIKKIIKNRQINTDQNPDDPGANLKHPWES